MKAIAYSKSQHIFYSLVLLTFIIIYCMHAIRCAVNRPTDHELLWLIPIMYVMAALCADFVSGLIHFLGDHPIRENLWLDQWFYSGFHNHHLDPTEMTQHSLVETNGLNALAACIILIPNFFYSPSPSNLFEFSLYLFMLFLAGMVFMTNQIHKWAHTTHLPKLVKLLQNMHLILNSRNHIQHHIAHDKYYCITTGWLNYFCYKTQIWERLTGIKNKN